MWTPPILSTSISLVQVNCETSISASVLIVTREIVKKITSLEISSQKRTGKKFQDVSIGQNIAVQVQFHDTIFRGAR